MRNNYKLYRSLALQFLGGKCVQCGATENLNIHHKDANPENNNKENLELLCVHQHQSSPYGNDVHPSVRGIDNNMPLKEAAEFREFNKTRMKTYRDKKRVRKYSPRPKKEQEEKEKVSQ